VRQKYILIDTAGMRKARSVNDSIEFFSVKRSEDSIARCDIAIMVIDARKESRSRTRRSRTKSWKNAGRASW